MQKVIILKGLPASGKSTYARQYIAGNKNFKRINKDLLREMLDFVYTKENEDNILMVRDFLLTTLLLKGYSVIIDDTNLAPKHTEAIKKIVSQLNGKDDETIISDPKEIVVVEKFIDTPVFECIERDRLRGDKAVGEEVILKMYKDFLFKPVAPTWIEDLPKAIIVDIDGTLAFKGDRGIFDFMKVGRDIPNRHLINIVNDIHCYKIILSGREDKSKEITKNWLEENGVEYSEIHMRKTGDRRGDEIIKKEIYDEFIKGKFNIIGVFDDRPKIVRMWKEQGLFVLDVNREDSRMDF